jgi:hypothetical protein
MIQHLIIGIIFLAAILYVARMLYKSFTAKSGCSTGCGQCNAVDFEKIEKQLKQKGI